MFVLVSTASWSRCKSFVLIRGVSTASWSRCKSELGYAAECCASQATSLDSGGLWSSALRSSWGCCHTVRIKLNVHFENSVAAVSLLGQELYPSSPPEMLLASCGGNRVCVRTPEKFSGCASRVQQPLGLLHVGAPHYVPKLFAVLSFMSYMHRTQVAN